MIDHSPTLRARIAEERSRSASNTMTLKEFPGGILSLVGANSAADLRSMSARFVGEDEIDGYPPTLENEGDPVVLAERATRSYGAQAKVILWSTPTIAGRSRIEAEYLKSDQRRYFVPCPSCGEMQLLYWQDEKTGKRGIHWEGTGLDLQVWYECVRCAARITEGQKAWMLENGEWRAKRPELSELVRGYWISALYAPSSGYSWAKAVDDFLRQKDDPEQLRQWVNLTLAETWQEKGDAPPWEDLFARAEDYPRGVVPAGGYVLVAGADVQRNRIEVEVVAWGPRMESWSVDYVIINGDTAGEEPWAQLDEVLARQYPRAEGGSMPIRLACIDSGFAAQTVYHYCRVRQPGRAMAVKGSDTVSVLVGLPSYVDLNHQGRRLRKGVQLWPVGVSIAKRELYGFLRARKLRPTDPTPFGFCHFPNWGEEWFKQLTAEQLVARRNSRNFLVYEWAKVRERNEALDARVYARAAAGILGVDRWTERDWALAAGGMSSDAPAAAATPEPPSGEPARRGPFDRWRQRPRR
jgi:phage terminase large subunit GpA-like protein